MTQYNSPEDIPWFQEALKKSQETMDSTPEESKPSSMRGRVFYAPVGTEDWQEMTEVSSVYFTGEPIEGVEMKEFSDYSFTVEFKVTPKLWKTITGLRMPIRYQIAYYARECTSYAKKILQKLAS